MDPALIQDIFQIKDQKTFRETALKVFYFQAAHTPVYRDYLAALGMDPLPRLGRWKRSLFCRLNFLKPIPCSAKG